MLRRLVCLVVLLFAWLAIGSSSSALEKAEVLKVLDEWVASTKALDSTRLLSCYAPRLERFYSLRNVPIAVVRKNKEDAFAKFSAAKIYSLRNIQFENLDATEARVVFDKEWDFRTPRNRQYAGSGKQRLTLLRTGMSWRITGEEDLAVSSVGRLPQE